MITTQPVKEDELRVPTHAQFELNGLDSLEQKKQFASNILRDEEDVKRLLKYLEEHDLVEMAEIPLLSLMLYLLFLWKEKKYQLPTSCAEIYVGFIQNLLDHMATKDLEKVATDKSIDEYQEELCKIGKLAFDVLLEDCLNFNFSNEELKVKKNETVTCLSRMDTFEKSRKMAEALKFVCELSPDAVGIVFDHLHYFGEKEGLTNYIFTRTPSVEDLSVDQCELKKHI